VVITRYVVKMKAGRVARVMEHVEHAIYGVTYLMIGYTGLEILYYAFGTYVLCMAVLQAWGTDGGEG
jgi:hypothetical protein